MFNSSGIIKNAHQICFIYHVRYGSEIFHNVYSNYSQSINIHVHSGTGIRIHYSILIPVTYWYQDPLQYPHSCYLLVPGSITAFSFLVPTGTRIHYSILIPILLPAGTRIHYSILIPILLPTGTGIHYSIFSPVTYWYQDPLQHPQSCYLLVPGSITAFSFLVPTGTGTINIH